MADVSQIRKAIATRLEAAAIPMLRVYDRWPNTLDAPRGGCAVIVKPSTWQYEQSFGTYPHDRATMAFELHCFVDTMGGIPNAEEILDAYLSNSGVHSIRQGLAAERRLGGEVDSVFIEGGHSYDLKEWPDGHEYVGAVLDIRCEVR